MLSKQKSGINPRFEIFGSKHARWIENADRYFRIANDNAGLDGTRNSHYGWYLDEDCIETVHGAVLQLPARNGSPQYVPAVADPWNDGAYLVFLDDIYDEEREAAGAADEYARLYAEDVREENARARRELELEELAADKERLRATHSAICKGLADTDAPASVTNAARWRLAEIRKEYRQVVERMREYLQEENDIVTLLIPDRDRELQ